MGAILALPFIGFGVYDVAAFQSRRALIEKMMEAATPDEKSPSPMLKKLIRIAMKNRRSDFAARILINELEVPRIIHGSLGWHATNALWSGLVALHMSEDEQVTIIISRSYMGNGRYGYSAESVSRFGRPLSQLSQEELIALVAITHAPSLYLS